MIYYLRMLRIVTEGKLISSQLGVRSAFAKATLRFRFAQSSEKRKKLMRSDPIVFGTRFVLFSKGQKSLKNCKMLK